jgi:hypothetical protein
MLIDLKWQHHLLFPSIKVLPAKEALPGELRYQFELRNGMVKATLTERNTWILVINVFKS